MNKSVTIESLVNGDYYLDSINFKENICNFLELNKSNINQHCYKLRNRNRLFKVKLDEILDVNYRSISKPVNPHFVFMTDFCGSTLLLKLLSKFNEVIAYDEPPLFKLLAAEKRMLDYSKKSDKNWRKALDFSLFMKSVSTGEKASIIKEQPYTQHILNDIQSTSKIVYLYSSLKEYLVSVAKHQWRVDYSHTRLRQFLEYGEFEIPNSINLNELSDFEKAALHWFVIMQHASQYLLHENFFFLESSDLFNEPEKTIRKVSGFLYPEHRDVIRQKAFHQELLNKHSKVENLEYDESARLRDKNKVLESKGEEIESSIQWLITILSNQPKYEFVSKNFY